MVLSALQRKRKSRLKKKLDMDDSVSLDNAHWTEVQNLLGWDTYPETEKQLQVRADREDKYVNDENFNAVCAFGPDGFRMFSRKYGRTWIKDPDKGRIAFARATNNKTEQYLKDN